MRLPRDLSGMELAKLLHTFGYQISRQIGSHMRLTTQERGQHHVTIPNHPFLRVGTLASIFKDICGHFEITREELIKRLLKGP